MTAFVDSWKMQKYKYLENELQFFLQIKNAHKIF